jgi:CheY-like chemotaxis protein
VRIEVWDTGRGIPAAQLHAIFEEFYQLDSARREMSEGVGLGLSIVRRLARMLGHRLDVRSWPGRGSMFAIELPVAPADALPPAAPPDARLAGVHVLLLEDDAAQRVALKHILGQWGCAVTAVPSLDAALVALDGGRNPDVVLTDFRLPGHRNGFEAMRLLSSAIGRDLPGVILTGAMSDGEIRDAAERGYAILLKPVDPARLGAVLAQALGR